MTQQQILTGSQRGSTSAADREMMVAIDETIAATAKCSRCGGAVSLETTRPSQPYQAWLVCRKPACRHKTKLT